MLVDELGNVFQKKESSTYGKRLADPIDNIIDKAWLNQAFLIDGVDLEDVDKLNRYWSTADLKFTDTSLGGNIGINSRPQPNRLTDIKSKGRRKDRPRATLAYNTDIGMGTWYSRTIDDNSETLFLEMGIPEFNNLITFWSRSIDYATSVVANTGRSPIAYNIASVIGAAAVFVAFPIISTVIYGVKAIAAVINTDEDFSYYYMKPTMVDYWSTVNSIVTTMLVELGILAPFAIDTVKSAERIGIPMQVDDEDLTEIKNIMPGLFSKDNNIDMFYVATKAQALANEQLLTEKKMFDEGILSDKDFIGYVKEEKSLIERSSPGSRLIDSINSALSIYDVPTDKIKMIKETQTLNNLKERQETLGKDAYGYFDPSQTTAETVNPKFTNEKQITNVQPDGTIADTVAKKSISYFESFAKTFDSSVRGGGQYAAFKVNYIGSLSESVSNSVTNIPAGDAIKEISNKVKSIKFSLSGGNILPGTQEIMGYVQDVAVGALNGLTFGLSNIIPSLLGGAYPDLPQMWDDSSFDLPQIRYGMQLISPTGDVFSRTMNEYIPLAMIIAAGFPRSTGPASYTSPFLVRSFVKGKTMVRLGMITSIDITRATANLGYDRDKKALGFDVSFTVTDLSSIMAAPVNSGMFSTFFNSLNDGGLFNRYIQTIMGRDLMTNKFAIPRAKIKLSRALMTLDTITSSAQIGMRTGSIFSPLIAPFTYELNMNMLDTSSVNR